MRRSSCACPGRKNLQQVDITVHNGSRLGLASRLQKLDYQFATGCEAGTHSSELGAARTKSSTATRPRWCSHGASRNTSCPGNAPELRDAGAPGRKQTKMKSNQWRSSQVTSLPRWALIMRRARSRRILGRTRKTRAQLPCMQLKVRQRRRLTI